MPRCKECKEKFEPKYFNQKFCMEYDSCVKAFALLSNKEAWKEKKKVLKESLKTKQDYIREVQVVFNKWIRLRDSGLNCISCNKPAKKENAGHYRSVGGTPSLRFNPLNCHLQCEYCNTFQHGNLIPYRKNLIKKIGVENVEWLEKEHEPAKYTIPELILMKQEYKEKIRKLK